MQLACAGVRGDHDAPHVYQLNEGVTPEFQSRLSTPGRSAFGDA